MPAWFRSSLCQLSTSVTSVVTGQKSKWQVKQWHAISSFPAALVHKVIRKRTKAWSPWLRLCLQGLFSLCVYVCVSLSTSTSTVSLHLSLSSCFPGYVISIFFSPHIYRDCFPAFLVFLIDSKSNRKVHLWKKKRKENPNVNLLLRSQCAFFHLPWWRICYGNSWCISVTSRSRELKIMNPAGRQELFSFLIYELTNIYI